MSSADIETIVIDAGSQSTKAGFAGESFPRCVIPTTVGRFRQDGLLDCVPDVYFGNEAMRKRGISKLTWPIKNGMVDNWDEMEKLLHHIFYSELHVAPEESAVLIAMHPLIEKSDKEKIAEILFEAFSINSLYLATSSALVLHASGRTSGVVWENGYSCSYATTVFEGFPLKHATVCSNIAGNFLTNCLQQMLDKIGYSFTTPVERDILEKIKTDLCYVALDYEEELKKNLKETIKYDLPDGQHVLVGEERFKCPEVIFQPSLQGFSSPSIVDVICSSINKCDMEYKALFFDNVVISGGSSMFEGLPERLSVELSRRVSELPGIKATVDAMPTRQFSSWAGGSILASLKSAKGFSMTRKEYEDVGIHPEATVSREDLHKVEGRYYVLPACPELEDRPDRLDRLVFGKKLLTPKGDEIGLRRPLPSTILGWCRVIPPESHEHSGVQVLLRSFEKPVVVIDNGRYNIKAGFACDNHPVSIFRTLVGRPNYLNGKYGREYYDVYIGDEAAVQGDLEANHPVVCGKIEHWDNMERIWHHVLYRELKVAPEDRAIILACGAKSTMKEKVKCCEIFFETLNCPAFCIQPQPVLSMYGSGSTTGICVDIGYDTTDIVPIFEGGMVNYAHMQTGIAGFQITEYIKNSLRERNLLHEIQTLEDIENIKKHCLYVTLNSAMMIQKQLYKLASGVQIDISNEAYMAAELMFQPSQIDNKNKNCQSLHDAVVTAALKCDAELRSELCDAIVLCGGTSTVPGINDRLQMELHGALPNNPVTILTSSEPYAVAWLGGATFAGLPDAEKLWIKKKHFEDYGEKIVKNKFM